MCRHQLALQLVTAGGSVLSRLPGPWRALRAEAPPLQQLLAWNCSQPLLAVGHGGSGAVLTYDAGAAADAAAGDGDGSGRGVPELTQPRQVLTHQLQQQVCSLAWRPVHSSMLAVGCSGGVGPGPSIGGRRAVG